MHGLQFQSLLQSGFLRIGLKQEPFFTFRYLAESYISSVDRNFGPVQGKRFLTLHGNRRFQLKFLFALKGTFWCHKCEIHKINVHSQGAGRPFYSRLEKPLLSLLGTGTGGFYLAVSLNLNQMRLQRLWRRNIVAIDHFQVKRGRQGDPYRKHPAISSPRTA